MPSVFRLIALIACRLCHLGKGEQRLCLLLLVLFPLSLRAQNPYEVGRPKERKEENRADRGLGLQTFTLHPQVVDLRSAVADTIALDYYHRRKAEGRSPFVSYLGNLISPMHHKSFFHRPQTAFDFPYNHALNDLIYRPDRSLFYRTRSPYTNASYQRNGNVQQREDEFDFTLAVSANRYWGFGADFNYTDSKGYYIGSRSKMINYRIFGNISLPRYEAWGYIGNNYMNMTENGGITDDDYILHPEKYASGRHSLDPNAIPVHFPRGVWNQLRNGHFVWAHRYNWGGYHPVSTSDSLNVFGEKRSRADSMVFVPIVGIAHKFSYRSGERKYINTNTATWDKYPNRFEYFRKPSGQETETRHFYPFDSTYMRQIDNTLQLSMREGFRPWVKMGIDLYTRLENKYYAQQDSVESHDRHHTYNVVVGGRIARKNGKRLRFEAVGEMTALGEEIGALLLNGRLQTRWGSRLWTTDVDGWVEMTNRKPNYLMAHHHGSFLRWDQEMGYVRNLTIGGRLHLPRQGWQIELRSATLQNYIYWGAPDPLASSAPRSYAPIQVPEPIQVLALEADYRSGIGFLGWHLKALYQTSTMPRAIPLPTWSGYASLYTDFYTAKVMRTQLGIDLTWNSEYYTPYYEPATMQFVNQEKEKYGNFPLINLFANFRLKSTRFFFEYYNAGDLLITPSRRFSLAHYPINPPSFRMGICVDFNN